MSLEIKKPKIAYPLLLSFLSFSAAADRIKRYVNEWDASSQQAFVSLSLSRVRLNSWLLADALIIDACDRSLFFDEMDISAACQRSISIWQVNGGKSSAPRTAFLAPAGRHRRLMIGYICFSR